MEEEVGAIVREAVGAFESTGARVEEASVGFGHSQSELSELWEREVSVKYAATLENIRRGGMDLLGEHRGDLTPEYAELAERGRKMSAFEYKMDDVVRTKVFDAVQDVFENYDLLVTPTLSVPPFDNADNGNTVGPSEVNGEVVDPLVGWALTYPINFIGHPAASIPAGFTRDGLPVGLQIIGRRFADGDVLAASAAFEREALVRLLRQVERIACQPETSSSEMLSFIIRKRTAPGCRPSCDAMTARGPATPNSENA